MQSQSQSLKKQKQNYLQSSIFFFNSQLNKKQTFHLVPKFDSQFSKDNYLYNSVEKSTIRSLFQSKALVVCRQNFEKFQQKTQSFVACHIKLISQILVYGSSWMKIIAYGDDVERLSHIAAILQTSEFADCTLDTIEMVTSKSKPDTEKTLKVVIKITRTKAFEQEFLSETQYISMKELLISQHIAFQEEIYDYSFLAENKYTKTIRPCQFSQIEKQLQRKSQKFMMFEGEQEFEEEYEVTKFGNQKSAKIQNADDKNKIDNFLDFEEIEKCQFKDSSESQNQNFDNTLDSIQ